MPRELHPEHSRREVLSPPPKGIVLGQIAQHELADAAIGGEAALPAQAKLEAQLADAFAAREVAQPLSFEERAKRCLYRGAKACDERLGVDWPGIPPEPVADMGAQLGVKIGAREIDALEHLVHEGAELCSSGDGAERQVGGECGVARRDGIYCLGRLVGRAGVTETLVLGIECSFPSAVADRAERPSPVRPDKDPVEHGEPDRARWRP